MTNVELLELAKTRMKDPSIAVWKNREGVWVGQVTDFDCAQGVEVHGTSEAFVWRALEGTIRCFPELEAK